jgi:hypothetical protein
LVGNNDGFVLMLGVADGDSDGALDFVGARLVDGRALTLGVTDGVSDGVRLLDGAMDGRVLILGLADGN